MKYLFQKNINCPSPPLAMRYISRVLNCETFRKTYINAHFY